MMPPNVSDPKFEKLVYHHLRGNPQYYDKIRPEYFTLPAIRTLFELERDHHARYLEVPGPALLKEKLRVGSYAFIDSDTIEEIFDFHVNDTDRQWISDIFEAWVMWMNLVGSYKDFSQYMKNTTVSPENIKDVVHTAVEIVQRGASIDVGFDLGLDFFDAESHTQPVSDTFPSGYAYIDQCLGGGFSKENLIVFAGEAKVGKCVTSETWVYVKNDITKVFQYTTIGDFYKECRVKHGESTESDDKFVGTVRLEGWQVATQTGWDHIVAFGKTREFEVWEIKTTSYTLRCADTHIVFDETYNEIYTRDLTPGMQIQTERGPETVLSVERQGVSETMYDFQLTEGDRRFLTSGIISHNSIWLGNIAANSVRLGHNTALITLELKDRKIIKRIGANLLEIPIDEYGARAADDSFIRARLGDIRQQVNFLEKGGADFCKIGDLTVKEWPTSTLAVSELEVWLRRAEEVKGIKFDLVVVDYLNILRNARNPNSEDLYNKIKNIAEDLRAMAQRNKWCVVSATQVNRSAFGASSLSMGHVAESAGLIHTVDGLFGITRLPQTAQSGAEYKLEPMAIRDGHVKEDNKLFNINWQLMRITEAHGQQNTTDAIMNTYHQLPS